MTFVCDVDSCTFEAISASSLKRHKVSHSAPLLHCDFTGCSFETTHSSNLKRHKLNHTSGFKCDFNECHFETNTALKLKRHSLTHSNETFKCDFNECHFETNTEPKLKQHSLTHTVMLKCDVCEYTSDLKHNLTRHKKEAHGQSAKGGKRKKHLKAKTATKISTPRGNAERGT